MSLLIFHHAWWFPLVIFSWENHRTREQIKVGRKGATSETITKKYTVKQSAKNYEWKTQCMMEYKKRHIHTYYTKNKNRRCEEQLNSGSFKNM
jgi:hypothetical protein